VRRLHVLAGGVLPGLIALGGCAAPSRPNIVHHELAHEVALHGTITTTGALAFAGPFVTNTGPYGAATCTDAARHGNTVRHQFSVTVGTSGRVFGYLETRAFRGAGTYSGAVVRADSFTESAPHVSRIFQRRSASRVTLVVRSDGSGTARFTGFGSQDGRMLDGVMTWTCEAQQDL
jgi:hypothetical protein